MPETSLATVQEGVVSLRNEPVQARSTARLTALLDAAAAVVDELGYERLTTAMVAERAGASIGTVYRYFPDRIVVLQALAARNYDRVIAKIRDIIADESHGSWLEAMATVYDRALVEAYRSEPGFRSLRVGDVIDLRPVSNPQTHNSRVAEVMHLALVERFGVSDTEEARLAFECSIEISDALVTRAFARDAKGDERFLAKGREIVRDLLEPVLG